MGAGVSVVAPASNALVAEIFESLSPNGNRSMSLDELNEKQPCAEPEHATDGELLG